MRDDERHDERRELDAAAPEFRVVLERGGTGGLVRRHRCDAAAPEFHLCNRGHRLTTSAW